MSRGEYDKIRYLISGRIPYVPFARPAVPSFFPPLLAGPRRRRCAREQAAEMPDEEDDLYERSPPHAYPHACPHARWHRAHEPRNLPTGRAQSHISFGPVTEKNVEQVSSPWPHPQWPTYRAARLHVMPHAAVHRASPCSSSTQQRPSCYPGARTGEEAQPRGVPGEVSQLARSVAQRVAAPSERLSGPEPSAHTGTGGQGWAMRQAASLSRCACRFSRPDITTNSTRTFGKHPSRSTRSSVRRPLDPCSRPCQPNLAPA